MIRSLFHFHKWFKIHIRVGDAVSDSFEVNIRKCECGTVHAYSPELRKWCEIEFLETTCYDDMLWHAPELHKILNSKSFGIYTDYHITATLRK